MKKTWVHVLAAIIVMVSSCSSGDPTLKNGTFTAESRSVYTYEPYWGTVTMTIRNHRIQSMDFKIVDKAKNVVFDESYKKYYIGNQTYINQVINDSNGLIKYIEQYNKAKNLDDVDAIAGATWSYNIFRDTITAVLEKARQ